MNTQRWIAQNEDGTYAVGEGDVEIATCKNINDAMRLKEAGYSPVAWLVTEYHANELQAESIQQLIDRAKHANMLDIKLRINGQDEWHEADWLKHLTRTTRREWQGLTDSAVSALWSWSMTAEAERIANTQQHAFARAIEAALKEKNGV